MISIFGDSFLFWIGWQNTYKKIPPDYGRGFCWSYEKMITHFSSTQLCDKLDFPVFFRPITVMSPRPASMSA